MTEYVFACPYCNRKMSLQLHLQVPTEPKRVPAKPQRTLAPATKDLDAELQEYNELLHLTKVEGALYYCPKKYLERDTWDTIDEIIRRYGGKWVPGATEERHWEVPTP
jgi:hypothetical protein